MDSKYLNERHNFIMGNSTEKTYYFFIAWLLWIPLFAITAIIVVINAIIFSLIYLPIKGLFLLLCSVFKGLDWYTFKLYDFNQRFYDKNCSPQNRK